MNDVTRILSEIEAGDAQAAEKLLPLVYEELRKLAAAKMAGEPDDHTLQPTALVHEAYLRLVASGGHQPADAQHWEGRGHFFAAAAEAMRRILVENARSKRSAKRGGGLQRHDVAQLDPAALNRADEILALDDALTRFAELDAVKSRLVELRYFAGLTNAQAAEALGISSATADRYWAYAKAWLHREVRGDEDS